jgi:hypothetical protein
MISNELKFFFFLVSGVDHIFCNYCHKNTVYLNKLYCVPCFTAHCTAFVGTMVTVEYTAKQWTLFATRDILPREFITYFGGTLTNEHLRGIYIIKISKNLYLDATPNSICTLAKQNQLGAFCNTAGRGSRNNAKLAVDHINNTVGIRARKTKILCDEEILIPYGTSYKITNFMCNQSLIYLLLLHY